MAELSDKLNEYPELKVMVRNAQGKYLAQDPNGLFFTDDRALAVVLRYQADHVPEQLESIRRTYGVALVADPVPLEEIYEKCDQCHDWFMPYMLFFDGSQFLCADCKARKAHHKAPGPARSLR
jgi:hypothetical protein